MNRSRSRSGGTLLVRSNVRQLQVDQEASAADARLAAGLKSSKEDPLLYAEDLPRIEWPEPAT